MGGTEGNTEPKPLLVGFIEKSKEYDSINGYSQEHFKFAVRLKWVSLWCCFEDNRIVATWWSLVLIYGKILFEVKSVQISK